ncbi:50S ribosomal protein L18 [candidate division WOR_3 bacterium SM23_60]|uniref:Large ribosomal subunit protein uL18 n=1 Tax=candidate division WOR_3 bacterium SM23_60 TaxID=1703780 RepID=A0A0S8GK12_UNCW3|nr:MAG: 50S ribosomal protein L18 [candidate division WOR_3 bacterium SM23_60]
MKLIGRKRRHLRIRRRIKGTTDRPRLCIFRSNRHISAQIIDDSQRKVICGVSSASNKALAKKKKNEVALEIGKRIAKAAMDKGIKKVAFDRAGYRYHGRVKALADGARETGLEF